MIWIFVILALVGFPIGIMVGAKFKMFSENKKLLIEVIGAICLVIVAGLIISGLVEIIPGGKGEFGNWLSFWGAIFGGIINTIVAALVSWYVTVHTYVEMDQKKVRSECRFKIQSERREEYLSWLKNLKTSMDDEREHIRDARTNRDNYNAGKKMVFRLNNKLKEFEETGDSAEQNFVNCMARNFGFTDVYRIDISSRKVAQEKIKTILKDSDYVIMAQLTFNDRNFGEIIDKIEIFIEKYCAYVDFVKDAYLSLKIKEPDEEIKNDKSTSNDKSFTIGKIKMTKLSKEALMNKKMYTEISKLPSSDEIDKLVNYAVEIISRFQLN
ncbi:YIP1 family protein [Levilactobacillus brevis]|uniref:YIP1 family protein n=1 Tax=Levilactobacillus brevis TaxID=1580 RepID=UPI0004037998|nr:YIP1 family protein [Levilactobacillus brevis]ATU69497.1 YIP1 family protein [Levilactobacillus brevis]